MLDEVWRDRPADILVNNAAAKFLAQMHRLSARAVDAVLGSTPHGAAYCTIGCGRRWIEAGQPAVVLSILTLSALQGSLRIIKRQLALAPLQSLSAAIDLAEAEQAATIGTEDRREGAAAFLEKRKPSFTGR